MKVTMLNNYNSFVKGETYEVNNQVGQFLVDNGLAKECKCTKDEDCEDCKGKTKKTTTKKSK